jgi:hypothetical protein
MLLKCRRHAFRAVIKNVMTRRAIPRIVARLIGIYTATLVLAPAPCVAAVAAVPARPNIIFIITDDQGYGDLSCHGNPILKTPNLDRLHAEAVRVPLLKDPTANWPARTLFTHVGRWERGQAAASKYANCAVRTPRYHLVSHAANKPQPVPAKKWELYDVQADPAEATDIAAAHPAIVAELDALYDRWWEQVLPLMTNEDAVGPKVNPFKEQYWKQFADAPKAGAGE